MNDIRKPQDKKKMEINIGESSEILKKQITDSSYKENVGLDLRKNTYFVSFWFMLKVDIDAMIANQAEMGTQYTQNIIGMVFKDNTTTDVDRKKQFFFKFFLTNF